jgi:hypothetical protein
MIGVAAMQSVYFCAGNTFTTGDRVATALIEYASVLARTNGFDVVDIPTRRPDGSTGRTSLVLSPSSQIATETLPHVAGDEDPLDEELIERLRIEMHQRLNPRSPQPERVLVTEMDFDF